MPMREQIQFFFRAASLILLWRGSWHLLDMYLFPLDPFWSNWSSLLLGVIFLLVADVALVKRHHHHKKLLDPKDCVDCAPQV